MSKKPGLYYVNYDKNKILDFLKNRQGNLCDYQRTHHPEYNSESIYAWMQCQDTEFRIQCRMYRNPAKKVDQINKFQQDLDCLNKIQDQKRWRQSLPEHVELFKGEMNK